MSDLDRIQIVSSRDNLSAKSHDYSNVYLLPTISLFGIITSIINIIVLVEINKKPKSRTFKYMLVNSLSDLIFLLIESSLFLIRCGSLCSYGYTRFAKVYEHYIFLYLGYVLVMFSALMDLSLSIDRLNMFMTKKNTSRISARRHNETRCFVLRCLSLFLFSAVVLIPGFLISRDTRVIAKLSKSGGSADDYELLFENDVKHEWINNSTLKLVYLLCMIAKGPVLLLTLFVANSIIVFKFRRHIKQKHRKLLIRPISFGKDTNETSRVTLMSVFICLTYFIGNALDSMYPVLQIFGAVTKKDNFETSFYKIVSNSLFFGSHGVSIFIFYSFNQVYRENFKKIFLSRTSSSTS